MKNGIDVCLAASGFPPDYSGPGIRFKRYEPGLRERGIRMRVFTFASRSDSPNQSGGRGLSSLAKSLDFRGLERETDGISVTRVPRFNASKKIRYGQFGWDLARYCREQPPDILHSLIATPWILPGMMSVRAAGIPIIYTQTMMPSDDLPLLKKRFYNLSYKPLSRVVVSSDVMRRRFRSRGVKSRIDVIPNGVDLERFRPVETQQEKQALRKELDIPLDHEVVLFVGGALIPRKGVGVLAKAWSRLAEANPKLHLILLGKEEDPAESSREGYATFLSELKETLRPFEDEGRVQYPGMVDNVEDYMRASTVFVFPSRREGMPNVVPEAFACGLPSIVAPFEGLPEEFGRPGREYMLVERNEEQMAEAMESLLRCPTMRDDFGRRARNWVEENLAVEKSLDKYSRLYYELAD